MSHSETCYTQTFHYKKRFPELSKPVLYSQNVMRDRVEISIIIPAYNEAKRLPRTLNTIRDYLEKQPWSAEVIVVNDGSTDETGNVAKDFAADWNLLRLVENDGNFGKGYSVRHGAIQAKGEIVLFSDADLSAPVTEIPKLLEPILRNECEITFGSRGIDQSLIGVHQPRLRELSGKIFNLLVRCIAGLPYKDTQCGFKAFRRGPSLQIFKRQTVMGFGFDPEVLYIGRKRGLRMREIPVQWNHVEGTTVRFQRDSWKMAKDLFSIRWNDLRGKYD
jgi:dolichyl-phosphate beta-glucosyltransferase